MEIDASPSVEQEIRDSYRHLLSVHRDFAASAGNCGTAARAICTFLRLTGIMEEPALAFLCEDACDDTVADPCDPAWIVEKEALLYHVLLDAGDARLFDDTGHVGTSGLVEMSRREYRDPSPFLIRGIDPESRSALQAIAWETNWSLPAELLCTTLMERDPDLHLRLFHGTTAENAEALLRDGFDPSRRILGANGGRAGHFYLTSTTENAGWYAGQEGVVLEVRVPFRDLVVDPEDGIGSSVVFELMSEHGLPANLATRHRIRADAFRRREIEGPVASEPGIEVVNQASGPQM